MSVEVPKDVSPLPPSQIKRETEEHEENSVPGLTLGTNVTLQRTSVIQSTQMSQSASMYEQVPTRDATPLQTGVSSPVDRKQTIDNQVSMNETCGIRDLFPRLPSTVYIVPKSQLATPDNKPEIPNKTFLQYQHQYKLPVNSQTAEP